MIARWDVVMKRVRGLVPAAILAAAASGAAFQAEPAGASTVAARPGAPVKSTIDRRLGEEEIIRRRVEWFYGPRRAGAGGDMAGLRRQAVEYTRERIRRQREEGVSDPKGLNFWTCRGPSSSNFGGWAFGKVSGRIIALAKDWTNNILYAGGASGGLWMSEDDGLSWTCISDNAGTTTIGVITVDPNDPDTLWVGTGENYTSCESYFGVGLLRTTDGGATWEQRNGSGANSLDLSRFASVIVDPRDSKHLVVGGRQDDCRTGSGTNGGIYTSDDAGATWTERLNGQVYEVVQDPVVQDRFWAGLSGGVYKSSDNGVTWVLQTSSGLPTGSTGRVEVAVSPAHHNYVYALFSSVSGTPEFWQTTSGGSLGWSRMSTGSDACDGQCWYNMVIRGHLTDPDTVYRGTILMYETTDGGSSWTEISGGSWGSGQKVHQDTHEFLMDPGDADTFYVGCDGGIWKTVDGGNNYTNLNANLNMTQFYAIGNHPTDDGQILGGSQDNSSLARSGSDVWDLQMVTGDGFVCHFNPVDTNYVYITSYPGSYPSIFRSTSGPFGGFSHITGSGSGVSSGDRADWVTPYTLDPKSPNILFLGTHRVYRSTDHGSNWTQVGPTDMTGGSGNILSLEVNRGDGDYVYAGTTSGRFWKSIDGGTNWTQYTTGLPSREINDIAGDPFDPDHALCVVSGFGTAHLWEQTGTGNWTALGGGLPDVPANTVFMLSDLEVFVGTDVGVYYSNDGGATFGPFMNGLPEGTVITDLKYAEATQTLTAGTYGRGAWQITLLLGGPNVAYSAVELPLTEVAGDGDGNVEPGETWAVIPRLRNLGGTAAADVTADLSTATPDVTVVAPATRSYGDIDPGLEASAASPYAFTVSPSFPCGGEIVFDLVNVSSTNDPFTYADQAGFLSITVVDGYEPPVTQTLLDEDFDPAPGADWSHDGFDPGLAGCYQTYVDEWNVDARSDGDGNAYHCGNGEGSSYSNTNYAWLRYGGRDSTDGPGLQIPSGYNSCVLTFRHRYLTENGWDGCVVVVDATEDDSDNYVVIDPVGGYGGGLGAGWCNGLEGQSAFSGDSGAWVDATFDLSDYLGQKIYLAFVFGSDIGTTMEGWWIDDVFIEAVTQGDPLCDVYSSGDPGWIEGTAFFEDLGAAIQASWGDSCNEGTLPGQTYSIHAGDLDALAASGAYTHVPLGGDCARMSPAAFTPGAGNEYYLVVPNLGGTEGGAGWATDGTPRPQLDTTCGPRQVGTCP